MYRLKLDRRQCLCCGICADVCPLTLIVLRVYSGTGVEGRLVAASQPKQSYPDAVEDIRCDGCGVCARECPAEALTIANC